MLWPCMMPQLVSGVRGHLPDPKRMAHGRGQAQWRWPQPHEASHGRLQGWSNSRNMLVKRKFFLGEKPWSFVMWGRCATFFWCRPKESHLLSILALHRPKEDHLLNQFSCRSHQNHQSTGGDPGGFDVARALLKKKLHSCRGGSWRNKRHEEDHPAAIVSGIVHLQRQIMAFRMEMDGMINIAGIPVWQKSGLCL